MDVNSRLISVSSVSCRACRDTRVYRRAFSIPAAMREANSVSRRLCSSVNAPGWPASTSITPMTLFLAMSGTASSDRTPGVKLITLSSAAQVVDQHRLAGLHRASGDALPDLDADALRHLGRMSHLKPHPQLLRFLVQQQDGKDFVIDKALQHLRYALQQCVQVKRGVDRIGDLQQVAVDCWQTLRAVGWETASGWDSY